LGEAVEDRDLLDRIGWSWENIDMVWRRGGNFRILRNIQNSKGGMIKYDKYWFQGME
jgi:hypothetical protein